MTVGICKEVSLFVWVGVGEREVARKRRGEIHRVESRGSACVEVG